MSITTAVDAAQAPVPLAGDLAGPLFAVGLIGAALLAAAILAPSTAYSVCEYAGGRGGHRCHCSEERLFYLASVSFTAVAATIVLVPGAALISILIGS